MKNNIHNKNNISKSSDNSSHQEDDDLQKQIITISDEKHSEHKNKDIK